MSFSASNALDSRLVESEKSLQDIRAEAPSLKKQVVHMDTEKADSDKLFAHIHEKLE